MKKNNNLAKVNHLLSKAFFYLLLAILIINIIGILYQFQRVGNFMEKEPTGRNNLGIFLAGWMMAEIYLVVLFFVAWGIRQMKKSQWLKLFLLILIFCAGIAPGVYFVIGVFLKK